MKISRISTLVTLGLAATISQAFITNGSFEGGGSPYGGPPTPSSIFTAGTPAPWAPASNTPDLYDNTGATGWGLAGVGPYQNMMGGVVANHGRRFIGFAASQSFGGINEAFGQNVSGLVVNQNYLVSAKLITDIHAQIPQYGGPYDGFGHVSVLFNSVLIGTFTQNTTPLTWQARAFTFKASATSGFLEFRAELDNANAAFPPRNSYMGLDQCEATAVPEPSSVLAIAGGLLGAGLLKRKKA